MLLRKRTTSTVGSGLVSESSLSGVLYLSNVLSACSLFPIYSYNMHLFTLV